jgi:hypothetical protein
LYIYSDCKNEYLEFVFTEDPEKHDGIVLIKSNTLSLSYSYTIDITTYSIPVIRIDNWNYKIDFDKKCILY